MVLSIIAILLFVSIIISYSECVKYEAESATMAGGVKADHSISGYSGRGYASNFVTDPCSVTFTVPIPTTGLYAVGVRYNSPSDSKQTTISVLGTSLSSTLNFAKTSVWTTTTTVFLLNQGTVSIQIVKGWGYFFIDFIDVAPQAPTVIKPVTTPLVNAGSSAVTKKLFAYLQSIYGKKVLTGQQSLDNIYYIRSIVGVDPAVASLDLMDYSPSRIQFGANPQGTNAVESWISWANENGGNGILEINWHWNAPSGLLNTADQPWYKGFYTTATTFNLAAALANPNGSDYNLLIRDMDAIAVQLKKIRDAGIPVLWRPLHEAYGKWFWWGASGSASFKALWSIMYNRFVNFHQLNNLVWVYNGDNNNVDYTPPSSQYDIYSLDLYLPNNDISVTPWSSEWNGALNLYNGIKMIGLSETGSLLSPSNIVNYSTYFSWFSVWSGTYITNQKQSDIIAIYNASNTLTKNHVNWRN